MVKYISRIIFRNYCYMTERSFQTSPSHFYSTPDGGSRLYIFYNYCETFVLYFFPMILIKLLFLPWFTTSSSNAHHCYLADTPVYFAFIYTERIINLSPPIAFSILFAERYKKRYDNIKIIFSVKYFETSTSIFKFFNVFAL